MLLSAVTLFASPAFAAQADPVEVTVFMKDGTSLSGLVDPADQQRFDQGDRSGTIALTASFGEVELQAQDIGSIASEGTQQESEPLSRPAPYQGRFAYEYSSATRYYYAPSAIMMKQGELSLSQRGFAFTSAAIGVTDHVTVLAGTIVPTSLSAAYGGNFDAVLLVGGLKAGGQLAPGVHVAAGGEFMAIAGLSGFISFAEVTFGDTDRSFSIAAGRAYELGERSIVLAPLTFSGHVRFTNTFALISENWILLPVGDAVSGAQAYAIGGRWQWERFYLDAGGIMVGLGTPFVDGELLPIPLPWLNVGTKFQLL